MRGKTGRGGGDGYCFGGTGYHRITVKGRHSTKRQKAQKSRKRVQFHDVSREERMSDVRTVDAGRVIDPAKR